MIVLKTFGCGVENLTLTLAITIDLKRVKFHYVVPSSSVPYIHMHPSSPQSPTFTLYSLLSAVGNRILLLQFFLDTDGV